MVKSQTQNEFCKSLFNFILKNAPAGIIVVDGQMLVTEINPIGEKITGYNHCVALGRPAR